MHDNGRLGTNGCIQVWVESVANVEMLPISNTNNQLGNRNTGNNGNAPCWVDVAADGVTPMDGVEYTFRVTFDYVAQTYSVKVKCVDEWQSLKLTTPNLKFPTSESFYLATRGSSISRIKFTGETTFTSLIGESVKKLRGFILSLF